MAKKFEELYLHIEKMASGCSKSDLLDLLSLAARNVQTRKDLSAFVGLLNWCGVPDFPNVEHSNIGSYLDSFKALLERNDLEPFEVETGNELAVVAFALLSSFFYE